MREKRRPGVRITNRRPGSDDSRELNKFLPLRRTGTAGSLSTGRVQQHENETERRRAFLSKRGSLRFCHLPDRQPNHARLERRIRDECARRRQSVRLSEEGCQAERSKFWHPARALPSPGPPIRAPPFRRERRLGKKAHARERERERKRADKSGGFRLRVALDRCERKEATRGRTVRTELTSQAQSNHAGRR